MRQTEISEFVIIPRLLWAVGDFFFKLSGKDSKKEVKRKDIDARRTLEGKVSGKHEFV